MSRAKLKILSFYGTRPEAIKMAPVIHALDQCAKVHHQSCDTGQHHEMVRPLAKWFGLRPDYSLKLMTHNQGLSEFAARALIHVDRVLQRSQPDIVLCQGDTTTAMVVALAAFHRKIKMGHVEAGLRTWNRQAPWPEEINRRIIDLVADYYFAPTPQTRKNLLQEKVPNSRIWITGNTTIDALLWTLSRTRTQPLPLSELPTNLRKFLTHSKDHRLPFVVITSHRRESFGEGMISIAKAIRNLAKRLPQLQWIFPVHLNPKVRKIMYKDLSGISNVHLLAPLTYPTFCYLLSRCVFALTDSGGLQEEGPSIGTPVFVMRDVTERPEGISCGNVALVGTQFEKIEDGVIRTLQSKKAFLNMQKVRHPFGDGKSAQRMVTILSENQK
jgi:UDP-N-acetylglucosamine 2-epimerase